MVNSKRHKHRVLTVGLLSLKDLDSMWKGERYLELKRKKKKTHVIHKWEQNMTYPPSSKLKNLRWWLFLNRK